MPSSRTFASGLLVALVFVGFTTRGDTAGPQGFGASLMPCPDMGLCGFFFTGTLEPLVTAFFAEP